MGNNLNKGNGVTETLKCREHSEIVVALFIEAHYNVVSSSLSSGIIVCFPFIPVYQGKITPAISHATQNLINI